MKPVALSLFILTALSAVAQKEPVIPVNGYKLVWQDEFNGNVLNRSKWGFRGLGKRGDAYNTKEAVTLDGRGNLIIEARKSADSITTGMIHTENLFDTRYGYFECRASLTKINGIWPAFWLQSGKNVEGGTPENNGIEIDIFEYFRNEQKSQVSHTLHWGGYGAGHKVFGPFHSPLKATDDGFHTFGLEWTPDSYSTFVDGVKTYTTNKLISKTPEFIILSLEVNKNVAGPVALTDLPDRFVVDYVRVYKKQ